MSGQLADGQPADAEATLRRALLLAAGSVEPSAGGLDKIRAKIAARGSSPLRRLRAAFPGSSSGLSGLNGLAELGGWLARSAGAMLALAWDQALDRFGPDSRRTGVLRWLRPASAAATAAFVIAAASWVIATLPHTPTQLSGPNPPKQVISVGGQLPASPTRSPSSSYLPVIGPPWTSTPSPSPSCISPGLHVATPSLTSSPSVTPSTSPTAASASPSAPASSSQAPSPAPGLVTTMAGVLVRGAWLAKPSTTPNPSPTPSPGPSSSPVPRTGPCLRP